MVRVFTLLWSDNVLCGLLAHANLQLSRKFGRCVHRHVFVRAVLSRVYRRVHPPARGQRAYSHREIVVDLVGSFTGSWVEQSVHPNPEYFCHTDGPCGKTKSFYCILVKVSALCTTQYLNLLCLLQPILNLKVPFYTSCQTFVFHSAFQWSNS